MLVVGFDIAYMYFVKTLITFYPQYNFFSAWFLMVSCLRAYLSLHIELYGMFKYSSIFL